MGEVARLGVGGGVGYGGCKPRIKALRTLNHNQNKKTKALINVNKGFVQY